MPERAEKRGRETRRLLVLSYHFPPDGAMGGQRWAALSKYLARAGWEVHVVTASRPNGTTTPPGVRRVYRARRTTLNEWYRARNSASGATTENYSNGSSALKESSVVRFLKLIRKIAGSAAGLPDSGRGWLTRAALAARAAMREADFDCIISSGPPHSSAFAAFAASLGTGVEVWIDMRDPWSITHEMNTPTDTFIRSERFVLRQIERLALPRASRVLANTAEFATSLRSTYPSLRVTHFPNGVDLETLPVRDLSKVVGGSIAYVGTLYAGRSLSSLFAAMRQVSIESPEIAASLRLNIAGALESPHKERMQAEIDSHGVAHMVNLVGLLPRASALELLNRSNLAIVLAQDQPLCVPAKVYESVGLGTPTLVIAEEKSAASNEAHRIGAFAVEGDDVAGIKALLVDMLTGKIPSTLKPSARISYEELAFDMDRLLRESVPERDRGRAAAPNSLPRFA